jgi:hypothetical protein
MKETLFESMLYSWGLPTVTINLFEFCSKGEDKSAPETKPVSLSTATAPTFDPTAKLPAGVLSCRTVDFVVTCETPAEEQPFPSMTEKPFFLPPNDARLCGSMACADLPRQEAPAAPDSEPGWSTGGHPPAAGGQGLLPRGAAAERCGAVQIPQRSVDTPALAVSFSVEDTDSELEEVSIRIGTFAGADNILSTTALKGASAILDLRLPEFAADGGRPLFVTLIGRNQAGGVTTAQCRTANYDVTLPVLRIAAVVTLQSHTSTIRGTYVAADDTRLVRLQYAIGTGPGASDDILAWHDVPLHHRPSADDASAGASPLEHFEEPINRRLFHYMTEPARDERGVNLADCAAACLRLGEGLTCRSFTFSQRDGPRCMLNDVEADPIGEKNRLLPFEDYQHFTRDDLVVGQEHAGDIVAEDLFLSHGTRYYLKLRARNELGYESLVTSKAISVDVTPPLTGLLNSTARDDTLPDFCDAAPTQRCFDTQASEGHRIIVDGTGSSTAFNGYDLLYDWWYQRINVFFASNWDGLHDPESSLHQVLVAWGTEPCGTDIKDCEDPHAHLNEAGEWTHTGLATPLLSGTVPDGDYFLSLKALNAPVFGGSGVTTVCHFQPLRVDTTAPLIFDVQDPMYDVDTAVLMLRYNATDTGSWIRDARLGLGRSRHDVHLLPWMLDCSEPVKPDGHCPRTRLGTFSINHFYQAKIIPGGLPEGVFVHGRLSVTNNVDLPSYEAGARPFLIDTSPPLAGEVNDGPFVGHDLYWENNATVAAVNFLGFSDPESGIGRYEWCLGTSMYGCEAFEGNPLHVPASDRLARAAVSLEHNVTYYSTITAFNQGLVVRNVSAVSDGVRLDNTPPQAGTAVDGSNASQPQIWTSEPGRLTATWFNFTDPESEVVEYYVSVGRRRAPRSPVEHLEPSLHLPLTPVGCGDGSGFFDHKPSVRCDITGFERRDMAFEHGETYYVVVEGLNGAHDRNSTATTGVSVDVTPPVVVALGDGTAVAGQNRRFVASPDTFSANFVFEDPESGVTSIAWQLVEERFGGAATRRLYPPAGGPVEFMPLPLWALNVSLSGLHLETRRTYRARFSVANAAGRSHVYTTDGVEVDLVPPRMLVLRVAVDAPGVPEPLPRRQLDGTTAILWANVQGVLAFFQGADAESGVAGFVADIVAIEDTNGTLAASPTIASRRLVNPAARAVESRGVFLNAELHRGWLYRVCVRAEDQAGLLSNATCSTSVRIVADDIPGVAWIENAGEGVSHSLSLVSVRFGGFESERCGIVRYDWAVGTRPLASNVLTYTRLGIATRQQRALLLVPLMQGATYYATVRAETGCGNHLTAIAPEFVVDLLPPMLSNISVGLIDSDGLVGYQQSTRVVLVSVSATDPEVGVDVVHAALGSLPQDHDLAMWRALPGVGDGLRTGELTVSPAVMPGTAAVVSFVAYSRGRLPSTIHRAPTLTVDPTPPLAGRVSCPSALGVGGALFCTWGGFSDGESGIARVVASLIIARPSAADAGRWAPGDLLQPEATVTGGIGGGRFEFVPELVTPPPQLAHGTSVRVQVVAYNGAGLSALATSRLITVDATPPVPGVVTVAEAHVAEAHVAVDGAGVVDRGAASMVTTPRSTSTRCQRTRASIAVAWHGFADEEADIAMYEVSLGSEPGAADVMAAIAVAPTSSPEGLNKAMIWQFDRQPNAGEVVYVTVVAANAVGLRAGATSTTLAFRGTGFEARVWDGVDASGDVDMQASVTTLAASWVISDPCPVVLYEWALVDIAGNVVQPFVPLCMDGQDVGTGAGTNASLGVAGDERAAVAATRRCDAAGGPDLTTTVAINDLLVLKEGVTYVAMVRATNAAGDVLVVQSDGVTVTPYTPLPGVVYDGALNFADVAFQARDDWLAASWRLFGGDAPETPEDERNVDYYTISMGTNGNTAFGRTDIVPVTLIGQSFAASFGGLSLIPRSQPYFATVRAVAANGRVSEATSNGILVGYALPVAPGVVHIPAFQAGVNSLPVTFKPFASPEGIWFYEIALGTSRRLAAALGGDEVMNFTCVCLGAYRCPDRAEGCVLTAELDGTGEEVLEDVEGAAYRRLDGVVRVTIGNLFLVSSTSYYVTVRAVDRALGTWDVQSRALQVDTTPPLPPATSVQPPVMVMPSRPLDAGWAAALANGAAQFPRALVGAALHGEKSSRVAIVASPTEIGISWAPFVDSESGLDHYEVGLAASLDCSGPTSLDNVVFRRVSVNTTEAMVSPPQALRNHHSLVAVVRAHNRAGLASLAQSLPILLDLSPPQVGSIFGGSDIGQHRAFSPSDRELHFHFVEVTRTAALECPEEIIEFIKLPFAPVPPNPWLVYTANAGRGRQTSDEAPAQEFSAALARVAVEGLELETRRERRGLRLLASAASRKVPLMLHARYEVVLRSAGRPGALTSMYISVDRSGGEGVGGDLGFAGGRTALYNGTFQMDDVSPAEAATAAVPATPKLFNATFAPPLDLNTEDGERTVPEAEQPTAAPEQTLLVPHDTTASSGFGIQIAMAPPPASGPVCANRDRGECSTPCRFDEALKRCVRQYNLLLWSRTTRDTSPLQVETIALNFDPSVEQHSYVLETNPNEDENKQGGWVLLLSIDGLPAVTLYEIEAHSARPATLTVSAWSILSSLPDVREALQGWQAKASVQRLAFRVAATPACVEDGAFVEKESGLEYAVGLGTAPFLLDLLPLQPLAALSSIQKAVRWDANARALSPAVSPYQRQCEFPTCALKEAALERLLGGNVTDCVMDPVVGDHVADMVVTFVRLANLTLNGQSGDLDGTVSAVRNLRCTFVHREREGGVGGQPMIVGKGSKFEPWLLPCDLRPYTRSSFATLVIDFWLRSVCT